MKALKSIIFLILFSVLLMACSNNSLETMSVNTAPKNLKSDYWRVISVSVLGDVKIPGTKDRKVDHEYQVGVKIDGLLNSSKLLRQRPSDAVIESEVEKSDGDYKTLIFTDDFDGLKKWLAEN